MNSKKSIKSAFESMMFIWGQPLDVKMAADVFNISKTDAYDYFKELQQEYQQEARGIVIREVDKAFQFVTCPENADYIEKLCTPVKVKRLSQSALEVLAIVAYKQPVTKGEIEGIRGVKSDRVIEGLLKKELIEEKGRSTTIGRPIIYGTTDNFLKNFGFANLKELPEIGDIESIVCDDDEVYENGTQQIEIDFSIEEDLKNQEVKRDYEKN